ncbi:CstA-like transporter-associated (seleno)protein [Pantoea sp. MBD-2R]|uniref:YbdD/YjiX family protein n=1 Tax=unclassified Pantoea TaxID=2630326 RepID=UPI0011BDEB32|nr:CstA-like transporter-associated (seleno)protein [Pantoea sp. CCBC3-3-1]
MSEAIFARAKRRSLQVRRCYPLPAAPAPQPFTLRLLISRLAQSFRLMVGVQDYGNYVRHMQLKHPDTPPMTEKAFHRYCLDARYPSKAGKIGKCPC